MLGVIHCQPIRKADILDRCFAGKLEQSNIIPLTLGAELIIFEETAALTRFMLSVHLGTCLLIKEITVLDHITPLVNHHLPRRIEFFQQHLWPKKPGQLAIDCIAIEEIHGKALEDLISDGKNDLNENPFPTEQKLHHFNDLDIVKLLSEANNLLRILLSLGFIHTDSKNLGNIMARIDGSNTFTGLCFVDAAAITPLKSSPETAEEPTKTVEEVLSREEIRLSTTTNMSIKSFGPILAPSDEESHLSEAELQATMLSIALRILGGRQ